MSVLQSPNFGYSWAAEGCLKSGHSVIQLELIATLNLACAHVKREGGDNLLGSYRTGHNMIAYRRR